MSSHSSLRLVLPTLVPAILLLAGCSGNGQESASAVASIPTATSQASTSNAAQPPASADLESKRPQFRVDTTEAEKARLISVWGACLKRQGVPTYEKGDAEARFILTEADPADYPKQFKACAGKEPLYPAAMDPARNPNYNDDMRNWVKCINRESPTIKAIGTDDGPRVKDASTYNNASDVVRQKYDEVERNCQYEAFGRE